MTPNKPYQNELVTYRHRLGFSQKQVARLIGHAGVSMLSRYERGVALPPFLTAMRLGIVLRVPSDYLYVRIYNQLKQDIREQEEQFAGLHAQQALF